MSEAARTVVGYVVASIGNCAEAVSAWIASQNRVCDRNRPREVENADAGTVAGEGAVGDAQCAEIHEDARPPGGRGAVSTERTVGDRDVAAVAVISVPVSYYSCGASLAASSSCTYAVTFTPSSETAGTATLFVGVAQDPTGGISAALSGTGVTPLDVLPTTLAFGTVAEGHSSLNKTVTVYNYGGASVSLSESVTGTIACGGRCRRGSRVGWGRCRRSGRSGGWSRSSGRQIVNGYAVVDRICNEQCPIRVDGGFRRTA
jgi:hypothetical protein